jgi:hypothetical protein
MFYGLGQSITDKLKKVYISEGREQKPGAMTALLRSFQNPVNLRITDED